MTPYELIDPLEGGPKALVPHTDERCQFHRFLTPEIESLEIETLEIEPDARDSLTKGHQSRAEIISPRPSIRLERWVRTDIQTS
jgi:hypothetical protein